MVDFFCSYKGEFERMEGQLEGVLRLFLCILIAESLDETSKMIYFAEFSHSSCKWGELSLPVMLGGLCP